MPSLADSIINEDISEVRAHLYHGTALNEWDEYGFTPLIEAAIADNIEIAELLISHGADVNLKDSTGGTPLGWAVENNNLAFSQLLLNHGADANSYTFAGQPILVVPLLRQQTEIKKLLIQYGALLDFAQDYINAKLLGHMFELVGTVDILDPKNQFIEVDFEGFYLEFSLGIIAESFYQFKNHFAARQLRRYEPIIQHIIEVISRASYLIKFQQYRVNLEKHQAEIDQYMVQEPLLIPVAYEGHAITFIKSGNILVKCDRREDSRLYDNIYFYHINKIKNATPAFLKSLMFDKLSDDYVNDELPKILDLQPITELKVSAQISGNCSWANVEACGPALFFLLCANAADFQKNMSQYKNLALSFFNQWREWNKDRALNFCIQSYRIADAVRKACKAEILAAILFQTCTEDPEKSRERIEEILPVLTNPKYEHILQNYIKSYCYEDQSEEGKSFMRILRENGYLKT